MRCREMLRCPAEAAFFRAWVSDVRFQVSGFRPTLAFSLLTPYMKLHIVGTANRRISNVEGWNRCAHSFLNGQNSLFDVGRSMFDVYFLINPSYESHLCVCARLSKSRLKTAPTISNS